MDSPLKTSNQQEDNSIYSLADAESNKLSSRKGAKSINDQESVRPSLTLNILKRQRLCNSATKKPAKSAERQLSESNGRRVDEEEPDSAMIDENSGPDGARNFKWSQEQYEKFYEAVELYKNHQFSNKRIARFME